MVMDGTVQVVFGAKWCGHLHETQKFLVWSPPRNAGVLVVMMGDQCQIGQTVREPKFMRLLGTEEEQVETFGGKAYAHTRVLEEIIEELEHDDNGATVVKQDNTLDPHGGCFPCTQRWASYSCEGCRCWRRPS